MEDQQRQTDAGQAGVQSLQAPEEGHPQPQLDSASPAQLVRAQPRLDLSVGGDLESEDIIYSIGTLCGHQPDLLNSDPPHLHLRQQRTDQATQQQPDIRGSLVQSRQ